MNTSKKRKTKSEGNSTFQQMLNKIKEDRGLSVRAIAAMANVEGSVAQSWLTGAAPRDLQAVAKLAEALGLSFRKLLLGEEEPNTTPLDPVSFFKEEEFFEGICKVKITQLKPKSGGKKNE